MITLITGATSGIGLATARLLARQGQDVALVGRSRELVTRTAKLIRSEAGGSARITTYTADLAHRDQVDALISAVRTEHPRLDGLVLCAGVANPRVAVTDGIDTTLAVNHLAPCLLIRGLDDILTEGRIILPSSSQHSAAGPFDPAVFAANGPASGMLRYKATKLLTLLMASARTRHPHLAPLEVVDPGFVHTGLGRNARGGFRVLLTVTRPFQSSPETPARLIVSRLAADDFTDGTYRGLNGPARKAANACDEVAADRAWAWTNELLAEDASHR